MGQQSLSPLKSAKKQQKDSRSVKEIQDIYSMFEQSNKVLIYSVIHDYPEMAKTKIKNIEDIISQLIEPFERNQKYQWGKQISIKFQRHFIHNFEIIWCLNRQQFYQLLLLNCKAKIQDYQSFKVNRQLFQDYFYQTAIKKIQHRICDSFVNNLRDQHNIDFVNVSIIDNQQNNQEQNGMDISLPLFLPQNQGKRKIKQSIIQESCVQVVQQQIKVEKPEDTKLDKAETQYYNRIKMNKCSLLLPQTFFSQRSSQFSKDQVYSMLKYYHQFTLTIQQMFYSNNLISCPLKNFVFSIESKIKRKKIRNIQISTIEFDSTLIQSRKLRKTRQFNNNLLLYEIKEFLLAYTQFVWMYLQLNLMAESRLSKIINSQILYGIIFKSVWSFVDWIAERGFQFQQRNCDKYYQSQNVTCQANLSLQSSQNFIKSLQALRGQKHPQQYLKKVVVFYREVSKHCQNADELLLIYEQVIAKTIKEKGSKGLNLFRMRNIIQKLLNIDQYSMGGGQISYSWTTWCIAIELLRQKINYKYGQIMISKTNYSEQTK